MDTLGTISFSFLIIPKALACSYVVNRRVAVRREGSMISSVELIRQSSRADLGIFNLKVILSGG